jgi:putative phage-type endonuclease
MYCRDMTLSPEQLAERRTMITASDPAAILGVHPYRSPLDVFLSKLGLEPPEATDIRRLERMKWGNLIEPVLRDDYAVRHGARVNPAPTMRHPEHERHGATPDGLVYLGAMSLTSRPDRGWEGKVHTVGLRHQYGPAGTDEVPVHEAMQAQWGMHVTGLERWDLTAFIDGVPTDYVILRDDEAIGGMVQTSDRFWRDHVEAGVRPTATGADDTIARMFPSHKNETLLPATPVLGKMIETLRQARSQARSAKDLVEAIQAELKLVIGEASGVQWMGGADGKITWRKAKDSVSTDWHSTAIDFGNQLQLAASAQAIYVLRDLVSCWISNGLRVVECGPHRVDSTVLYSDLERLLAVVSKGPQAYAKAHQKVKPGGRRFCVPRSWGGDEGDDDGGR